MKRKDIDTITIYYTKVGKKYQPVQVLDIYGGTNKYIIQNKNNGRILSKPRSARSLYKNPQSISKSYYKVY